MVYELWRRADICLSLMDVLEEMLGEKKISEQLAVKLMEQVGACRPEPPSQRAGRCAIPRLTPLW